MSTTKPTNKTEARTRIAELRKLVNLLNSTVPEKSADGTVRYYAPNSRAAIAIFNNMAAARTQLRKYEQEITDLNAKFFAEQPATTTRETSFPPNSQSPGAAGPRVQRPPASQLAATPKTSEEATKVVSAIRKEVDYLRSIKPGTSSKGTTQYTVDGQVYTQAGYNKLIRDYELRANEIEIKWQNVPTGQQRNADVLYQRYTQERIDIRADLKVITDAARIATKVDEKERLQSWAAYIQQYLSQLDQVIGTLGTGVVPSTLPSGYRSVSVSQAKKETPPTVEQPSAPFTPGAGQGVFGQQPQQAPVGVAAPSQQAGTVTTGVSSAAGREGGAPSGTAQTTPTGTSRMPTLEEINRQRVQQGLSQLVVRNGQVVDPTTNQVIPNVSAPSTGQPPATTPNVSPGGVGGGAVGGTTTGTVPPAGTQPPASTQPSDGFGVPIEWEQAAREAYGVYFDVIKNIPELREFVKRLMTGPELSDAEFRYQLSQTTWWKQTTGSARSFIERQVTDPATLQTEIDNKKEAIKQAALNLGISVGDDILMKVATDQIKFGWSDQITLNYLGEQALGTTAGVADLRKGFYGQQIKETAAKYGVPLSDTTLNKWVADIATGQQNVQSFEAYARDLAKNLFPALSSGFDRGLTFEDMTAPYAQYASQLLEKPVSSFDFTDPKFAKAFTSRNDKGEQVQMSYGEWADYLRSDPSFGWEYTDQAKSQSYSIALELGRMFGRAG